MTDTLTPVPTTDRAEDPMAFAGELLSWLNTSTVVLGIDAGHRAGAFEALAEHGPATSVDLARAAGLSERHVREWLKLMATGGVVAYDPADGTYRLPAGAAACLSGDTPMNMAPVTGAIAFSAKHVPAVARTIAEGGGIAYEHYRPEFTDFMDAMNRKRYDAELVSGYLAPVAGLVERLEAGIRVADLGCGSGHVVNILGRAFPRSTFVGYDLAEDALEAARREAAAYGLDNVRFEAVDVAALPAGATFDLVTAFDAIHDQAAPRRVLAGARAALAEGGTFLLVDVKASSDLEDNIGNPMAPWLYGASLFHCMQVSLAVGGEGLGTAWGVQLAQELLGEAGFGDVTLLDAPPTDVMNLIYVCRP